MQSDNYKIFWTEMKADVINGGMYRVLGLFTAFHILLELTSTWNHSYTPLLAYLESPSETSVYPISLVRGLEHSTCAITVNPITGDVLTARRWANWALVWGLTPCKQCSPPTAKWGVRQGDRWAQGCSAGHIPETWTLIGTQNSPIQKPRENPSWALMVWGQSSRWSGLCSEPHW